MGEMQEISQFNLSPILELSAKIDQYGIRISKAKLVEYLGQVDQEWFSVGITEDSQNMLFIVQKDWNKDNLI